MTFDRDTIICISFGVALMTVAMLWFGVFDFKDVRKFRSIAVKCERDCDKPKKSAIINIDNGRYNFKCVCGETIQLQIVE